MSALEMVLFAVVGALLGSAFFSSLYHTVRTMGDTANPTRTLVTSFLLRAALLVVTFFWIASFGLGAMGMAMLGFLASRVVATIFLRPRARERE